MKLGLHARLLASLLSLLLIVFCLLGVVLLTDADNRINEFRETQARYQAKTLADGSLDGLVSEDYELLELWVQSSMPSEEYAYAALVRPDGKVLTHTDLSFIGEQIGTVINTVEAVLRQTKYKNRPIMEVIYPARIGEKIFANAHVAYYLDTESIFHRATILRIIAVLLLSLVLLVVASHFVTRTMTIPIERLRESVNQVTLKTPVEIDSTILNRNDEIGGLAQSFRDVSERLVDSYAELYLSMGKNIAIVESSIDGIVVIDNKGIIESANTALEHIFGYAKEELIGNNISKLMLENHEKNHSDYIQSYLQTKKQVIVGARSEFEGKRKDGSSLPIEISVSEIKLEGKSKFAGTIRDITPRYESEQAMLMAKEAAEEGSKVKSEFLATISHELRTPLNGIIGSIELIKDTGGLPEESGLYVDMANKSAHNLLVVLNDILDFSDMQSDRLELSEVKFNVRELFSSVIDVYAQVVKEKPISIHCKVDDAIPEWLLGDDGHIRGIVRNLLNNAIKFTHEGSVSVLSHLVEDMKGEIKLRIEVVDTGIGVDKKDQSRIFDLFTQADGSYTRRYGGTGIGLAICKRLIKKMGGDIGVESELGKGSTFWFTLTLKVPDDAELNQTPAGWEGVKKKQIKGKNLFKIKNKRLLIVEDEPANRQIIKALTTRLGYISDVAENGLVALNAIKENEYDLVLMDCQMPVMDGYVATREIRKYEEGRRHTLIVAVTANALKEDREECIAAGMDDYLAKPVNKAKLEKMISYWLYERENMAG